MADQWIEASAALDVFGNSMAICERCEAGLIRSRAQLFRRHKDELTDADLPREFWWAKGHAALDQNWDTGDFSTWINQTFQWQAFGVRFALDDLLKLIAFEQHAATRRRLSIVGSPAWASAREARRFAYSNAGLQPVTAGTSIIELARLGFITARAVEMQWAKGQRPDDWTREEREWDIPTWFWADFTTQDASSQDWEQGRFAGRGRGPDGYGWLTLNGVHFLRSSLENLMASDRQSMSGPDQAEARKLNLPEADLKRWWDKLTPVRDSLSQEQLRLLVNGEHPQHTVSRDRIRTLAEGRKPGPKSN